MGLVLFFTLSVSSLFLFLTFLCHRSRVNFLKAVLVAVASYLVFYAAVWLASHDEVNLKIDSVYTNSYKVFQSRKDLMMAYFDVPGALSDDDESGCFFYSLTGKVQAVPLSSFGLTDYQYITPMTRLVLEKYTMVGKYPYYFPVSVSKYREYLETIDPDTNRLVRFYFRYRR